MSANSATQQYLSALQHSDSFFPSGLISFSYGLESLINQEQTFTQEDVLAFLSDQLLLRWGGFDRGILAAVYHNVNDAVAIAKLDKLLDAMTLPEELRRGSRMAGKALMGVHHQLGSKQVQNYELQIKQQSLPGHLPIIQGLAWSEAGMNLEQAMAASAHGVCIGILGAAIRLGVLGHIGAQQLLSSLHAPLAALLATAVPEPDEMHAFTPIAEVASMRHPYQDGRLFAN